MPFAVAHCGLLLLGVQFSELPSVPALLCGLAPVLFAALGAPAHGVAAWRQVGAVLAAAAMQATAVAIVLANQPA